MTAYDGLSAVFFNIRLKRSQERSHTRALMDEATAIVQVRMLKDAGGIPAHGNRKPRDRGEPFDHPNPERS